MPQDYGVSQYSSLPSAAANGAQKQIRVDQYGAVFSRNEVLASAEDGTYFRATNPTIGTGIAQGIQTSFSATANVLLAMVNGSATKIIIPHYIRLLNTAAGASTTQARLAITTDTVNRYSSGGTDLTGNIVNSNTGLGPTSAITTLRFGVVTASAASQARTMANINVKAQAAPCWTVGDELRIMFGDDGDAGNLSGAAAVAIVRNVGPIALMGQNHSLLVHLWNVANATTAPSWEIEMAWWERDRV